MSGSAAPELVAPGPQARVVSRSRRVRLGDVSPRGRLRLDATVRYLQDVSDDDTRAAGLDDPGWVVRRTHLEVRDFPRFGDEVRLTTWCSGLGSRWAERRVTIEGDGSLIEAATLWVRVDPQSARPSRLSPEFVTAYGPSAAGRTVSARLLLDDPPEGVLGRAGRWPVRFVDFDAVGHVNNAASWTAVEEHLARRRELRAPMAATLEHRLAIERSDLDAHGALGCAVVDAPGSLALWLVGSSGRVAVAAVVRSPAP